MEALLRSGSAIGGLFDRLVRALAVAAGLVLVAATIVVLTEIVSRYFFHRPILGAIEFTEYCLLWATFLAVPWLQARNGNVRVDFILQMLARDTRLVVLAGASLLSSLVCAVIAYYGAAVVLSHLEMGYRLPTPLHPPSAPIMAVIPVGSALLAIQFLRQMFQHLGELREH